MRFAHNLLPVAAAMAVLAAAAPAAASSPQPATVNGGAVTVGGYVTDSSGHGWPMRAKITVQGSSDVSTYSDPYTGYYQLSLPEGSTYTLHATSADLPGYEAAAVPVDLTGSDPVNADIGLAIDASTCTAPGYRYTYNGSGTGFEGWLGKTPQGGWSIVDNEGNDQTWRFDDPGNRGNLTTGSGTFAIVDSNHYGPGGMQDTSLVSPLTDLTDVDNPEIGFDTDYNAAFGQKGAVDLSIDGGETWTTVWETGGFYKHGHVTIPIPTAAGKSEVQVGFHYTGSYSWWWQLDNVFIGDRTCTPTTGGLMAGVVTDQNTGDPVNAATVTSQAVGDETGTTSTTPADESLSDGYYWLFSSHTGRTGFTLTRWHYAEERGYATVPADGVVHRDFTMGAGHLIVDPGSVRVSERMGRSTTRTVTFENDGAEPVHVTLGETAGGFTTMSGEHQERAPGAPTMVVETRTSPAATTRLAKQAPVFGSHAKKTPTVTVHGEKVQLRGGTPARGPWTDIADYPEPVMDNAAAYHDGKVYVVGGSDGVTAYRDAHVYDPGSGSWSAVADMPEALNGASAAFIGNTLYVVGGWNANGRVNRHTYAYQPDSDSWTQVADLPTAVSAVGHAVIQGKLYVVGGCITGDCAAGTDAVQVYDPATDAWSQAPGYPTPVAYTACGGVDDEVICAGGLDPSTGTSLTATYAFVPGSGWTQQADLPMDAWGAASAVANGKLEVMGGAIHNSSALTNQGFAYDPAADEWDALPNSNNAVYRGGASCGIYKVGGDTGNFNPVAVSEMLPGYGDCDRENGTGDVPWLDESRTEFEVAPGAAVTVRVTLDAGAVWQPGEYLAGLEVSTDTPYEVDPVEVAMQVQPPRSWGKIAGTVKDGSGEPVVGATVQVCTMWDRYAGCGEVTYTLKTDGAGRFGLWLSQGYNPLAVVVAKDGYQPRLVVTRVHRGETTTLNITLNKT